MAKLTLPAIGSAYGSIGTLNANFDAIEAAFENTLSRDGTTPNQMEFNFDMNGYDILNTGAVYTDDLYINGVKVDAGQGVTIENVFQTNTFTATAGQTTFDTGVSLEYTNSILVTVNRALLEPSAYSVGATAITLVTPASLNDVVVIRRFTKRVYNPVLNDYRFENESVFDLSFSITNGRNAMSSGPITILDNIVVTIPTGSSWHII